MYVSEVPLLASTCPIWPACWQTSSCPEPSWGLCELVLLHAQNTAVLVPPLMHKWPHVMTKVCVGAVTWPKDEVVACGRSHKHECPQQRSWLVMQLGWWWEGTAHCSGVVHRESQVSPLGCSEHCCGLWRLFWGLWSHSALTDLLFICSNLLWPL